MRSAGGIDAPPERHVLAARLGDAAAQEVGLVSAVAVPVIGLDAPVAVIAPSAAALVITGFDAQATAHDNGGSRAGGDIRIALGVLVLAAMIAVGLYTLIEH